MPLILTEPLWTFDRLSSKGSLLLWGLNQPAFPVSLIESGAGLSSTAAELIVAFDVTDKKFQ